MTVCAACAGLADVALIIERTGAISPFDWPDIIEFLQQFVSALYIAPNGVHVACITYDSTPRVQFNFRNFSNRYDVFNGLEIDYSEGSGGKYRLFMDPSGGVSQLYLNFETARTLLSV